MSKSSLGSGNVQIELDGEQLVLRPNLKAAQTISGQAGGILAAAEAVMRLDLSTITRIIALGLGRETAAIEEAVYNTGVGELAAPVNRYLTILANGGRPPVVGGSEAPKGE